MSDVQICLLWGYGAVFLMFVAIPGADLIFNRDIASEEDQREAAQAVVLAPVWPIAVVVIVIIGVVRFVRWYIDFVKFAFGREGSNK